MASGRYFETVTMAAAALLLSGCGGGDGPAPSAAITVVAGSVATTGAARPEALPTPTPAPVPTTAATPALAALAPLDLRDMALWNYGGRWHASEWGNGMSPIGWRYDHVTQPAGRDTLFRLDAAGAPELQAMGGTPVSGRALWEADVTLPQLKDGLVVAPLWLWDSNSREEIDFELAGRRGLDVTIHGPVNGEMQRNNVRLFAGRDLSGERHRFGIRVDEAAGYVEMLVDGVRVHRWDRSGGGPMVSHPLKPMISMWAANPDDGGFVGWVGRWPGLQAGEALTMTVHGYGYTPLS